MSVDQPKAYTGLWCPASGLGDETMDETMRQVGLIQVSTRVTP